MKKNTIHIVNRTLRNKHLWFFVGFLFFLLILLVIFPKFLSSSISYKKDDLEIEDKKLIVLPIPPLDTLAYDKKLDEIANNPPPKEPTVKITKDPKTGVETTVVVPPKPTPPNLWPVKTVYPNDGAILPFKRIIAYYGNLYSTKMGVLGQYPEAEMLAKLDVEVKKWEAADPSTPVVPALHYIAVVAQAGPGADRKYRARMPGTEIEKVLAIAAKINAIVFLDIQVGFSNLQTEVPLLEKYLKLPNVHLGVDAEFSMKTGIRPGKI